MRRGFTLIEMLVALLIVAVLGGIVFSLGGKARSAARAKVCLTNLRDIGVGLESYLADHSYIMPELVSARDSRDSKDPALETVLVDYVSAESFQCPADDEIYAKTGSSYFWNNTQNGLPATQLDFFGNTDSPSSIPLVADKEAFHPSDNGTNILYADWGADDEVRFTVDR